MPQSAAIAKRFAAVDSVRGLAALAVACFHFYNQLALSSPAPLWGKAVQLVMTHGDLGVVVFFVLSGFVIACSLHGARIDALLVGKFALRRSLRLDPSYWLTIFLTYISLLILMRQGWTTRLELPTGREVVANMFYLDNLLDCRSIVKVGWTLCLEIQFYLIFVFLGWLTCIMGGAKPNAWVRGIVFAPFAIWSCLVYSGLLSIDQAGTFVPLWFMYFLGVTAWWALCAEVPSAWLWSMAAACSALAYTKANADCWVALATGLGLYLAGRLGRLDTWLSARVFHSLGRISYSFYLVHPLVGTNFIRFAQRLLARGTDSLGPFESLLLFILALGASLLGAQLLYRFVELPSHRLSRRIQWAKTGTTPPMKGDRPPVSYAAVPAREGVD
ncbi:MAG TPA: acyltransferase [Pirellulales bacterium]|jgi:hypothetical protein|nr:acyltransferase [Pirellulales bacterium]